MAKAAKHFRFRNIKTGLEFCCVEGDAVHSRVTGHDRADYELLGEADPLTGEVAKKARKAAEPKPETGTESAE